MIKKNIINSNKKINNGLNEIVNNKITSKNILNSKIKKHKKMNYKIKQAYGFICLRKNKITNKLEILLIKKQHTYAFSDFILGKYNKTNREYLLKLFNQMSYNEKIIISSLKFNNIWYYFYHNNPENLYSNNNNQKWLNSYIKKKNKFDFTFIKDGGKYLKTLIENSKSYDPLWDLPKGKLENNEFPIDASIRELQEETNIKLSDIKILFHLSPFIESYIDGGYIYRNTYYYAEVDPKWEPENYFNLNNIENADIKWIDTTELDNLYNTQYMFKTNNLKKSIKKYKQYKKNYINKYI
jgi:8-oxo-dGTP pyrophosphatase MutT (NUDIX family)